MKLRLDFDGNSYPLSELEFTDTPVASSSDGWLWWWGLGWPYRLRHLALTSNRYRLVDGSNDRFNDLGFYLRLRARAGGARVEIKKICVHHSDECCMGLEVYYHYGSDKTLSAPPHVYNSGPHSAGGCTRSELMLGEGEYLSEVRTRQGEITHGITFITNLRSVSFGGTGGIDGGTRGIGEDGPADLSRRIVAFVGSSKGVLHRLGAISINRNWEVLGPIVLLRALAERGRAAARADATNKSDAALQRLVTDVDEGIFCRTLTFLVPGLIKGKVSGRKGRVTSLLLYDFDNSHGCDDKIEREG